MGTFFVYIVKSSVCLALFYLFYKLLLGKETFHRFNRIALLSLIILSVLLPFCQIAITKPVMQSPVMDLEMLLAMASLVTDQEVAFSTPFWMQAILWVYLSGALFFLFLFIHSSFNIIRIIRKGDVMKLENGIRLVVTTLPVSPFSWMKYIVISEQDMRDSGDTIIRHEMAHIQSCHSLDLIIAECCVFLHWFNPAVWFF
ncbi:hypothetical protein LJC57_01605 [Parabacteroides sp. OttesenSCG-928-G07]|nr:hypothetical protein [Parabacteroides sp. OttesenSCG-928-G07]